jgi:hypothetical protein
MIWRIAVVRKINEVVLSEGKSSPVRLPPELNFEITGDYLSAWIWRHTNMISAKIRGYTVEIRYVVLVWRAFLWCYLVVTTEQLIVVNGFGEENSLTYGQTYIILLLIVPFGILWNRCYELFPKFAKFFDSIDGQKVISAFIALTLFLTYSASVYAHYEDANVQRVVWALAILGCFLPAYIRKECSEKVDSLLGNRTNTCSTSWWDAWSIHLQLRLPCHPPLQTKSSLADNEFNKNLDQLGNFHEKGIENKKDA